MSLQEKADYIKQIIGLVCETVPILVNLIKEIIVLIQKVQTV